MKLSQFNPTKACNEAKPMRLRYPYPPFQPLEDESGEGPEILVYGGQSDIAKNAQRERDRQYGKRESLTEREERQSGAELLAALTAGWNEHVEDDSGPLEFTRENAIDLYLREDWIARQVLEFSMNLRNYDPKLYGVSGSGSASSHGSTGAPEKRRKAG